VVRLRAIVALALAFALSACAQSWEDNPPTVEPGGMGILADGTLAEGPDAYSSSSALAARTASGTRQPYGSNGEAAAYEYQNGYRIGAGDRLTVRVVGEPELTADYLVDGAGNISMPYVRTIRVGGLTAPQVEKLVGARLREGYLRNPIVSAQVTTLRPFYILGEVTRAGSFAYQPGMTVQNAIAIAEGYTPRADQGKVLITRRNVKGTATFKVPVTTQVYPGDVIYVRERWF
jgi:polysaccharide export outer membrane protein